VLNQLFSESVNITCREFGFLFYCNNYKVYLFTYPRKHSYYTYYVTIELCPGYCKTAMMPSKSPTSLVSFLQVMEEEFSHTVIHRKPLGVFGQQRMPPKQPAKPAPGQFSNVVILNNFMLYTKCKSCLVFMLLTFIYFNNEVFIIVIIQMLFDVLFVSMCTNHVNIF